MKKDAKIIRSFRLDSEVLSYFEREAEKTGISINALINSALLQIARKKHKAS